MNGFKTIGANVLMFLGFALGWDGLKEWLDPQTIAMIVTVVNFGLRFITKTPVFKS